MTALFDHPRHSAKPDAPVRPRRLASSPLDRADGIESVPSFLPPARAQRQASWQAITATSRRLAQARSTAIPSDIESLARSTRVAIRAFDLGAATVLLALSLPVCLLIAVVVRCTSLGPVLYRSWRVGRSGTMYRCWKFRTMHRDAEAQLAHLLAASDHVAARYRTTFTVRNDPRVTRLGRFLRRTHLDELPQLFNVLGGSMSLVGPRPITPGEVGVYGAPLAETLRVKPGIIGAWQFDGRRGSYRERVESDLAYVRQRSLSRDLGLALRTARRALSYPIRSLGSSRAVR